VAGEGGIDANAWLEACRRMVAGQREVFADVAGATARTEYEGIGEGGDRTLVIDRLCEDVVFAELARLHDAGHDFVAVSEERGQVPFGDSPVTQVVVDPIDGSLNARRTIPSHSLSVAIASGDSMAEVEFGFVHDFGADEEFSAIRGEGVLLNGEPLLTQRPYVGLEVVGVESSSPERIGPIAAALEGRTYRLRAVGSIAISLAYVAAARFDAMLSGRECRSVDAAAGQLLVREVGGKVAFGELGLEEAQLDLDARFLIAAGLDEDGLATVLDVLRSTTAS
jgi:myo-inositol-1(or 4)-monophosphatase